jgi:ketosteroid isomerase-like protein
MKADAKTKAAVIAVLKKFTDSYKKRDMDGLLSVMAPDRDVVLFGTGVDERRVGLAQIKAQAERDWSQSESASMAYKGVLVSAAGSVAWTAGDVTLSERGSGGQELALVGRLTAVLEKRRGKWLIVQMHLSVPLAAQPAGQSFPT